MGATHEGGLKAAKSNRERYDKEYADEGGYYAHIGRLGGLKSHGGAFSKNTEFASEMGKLGGAASRRGKPKSKHPEEVSQYLIGLNRIAAYYCI